VECDEKNSIEKDEQQGKRNPVGSHRWGEATEAISHQIHRDTGEDDHEVIDQKDGESWQHPVGEKIFKDLIHIFLKFLL
jgi:hypothetical protein